MCWRELRRYRRRECSTTIKIHIMRNELYYRKSAALAAAEQFAAENNGMVRGLVTRDDRSRFDFEDDEMQRICWSGEMNAISVVDKDTLEEIGAFAYWDDEL